MAGGSLLALLDDIATVLDDVAILSKVAAKKTAGVLGDDIALNAEQVAGIRAERELPVVWAVAKGSAINKLILVPSALLVSVVLPWAILPLLMLGGAYLCFEGVEKVLHSLSANKESHQKEEDEIAKAILDPDRDLVAFEKQKIKGAIRTDFILSAEIIVIALGVVKDASFTTQATVVSAIAALMTIGVYALVAGIVKLDDFGLYLLRRGKLQASKLKLSLGTLILKAAPFLMKALSVVGTLAMFLVGGGILMHGIKPLETYIHQLSAAMESGFLQVTVNTFFNAILGVCIGALVLLGVKGFSWLRAKFVGTT